MVWLLAGLDKGDRLQSLETHVEISLLLLLREVSQHPVHSKSPIHASKSAI